MASLDKLPPELRLMIFRLLISDDPHRSLETLLNLMLTSRRYRAEVGPLHALLRWVVSDAAALDGTLHRPVAGPDSRPPILVEELPILELLSSRRLYAKIDAGLREADPDGRDYLPDVLNDPLSDRLELMEAARDLALRFRPSGPTGESIEAVLARPDSIEKAMAIGEFASDLEFMGQADRTRLVSAVLDLSDRNKATAIDGLGAGLRHLLEKERSALVTAALGMAKAEDKDLAIGGLGAGILHLRPDEQAALFAAAPSSYATAKLIAGYGAGLGAMPPDRRSALVEDALALQHPYHKAMAIAGLGAGLEHLLPDERTALVEAVLRLDHSHGKAMAIAGMAAGLEVLEREECRALVRAALGLTDRSDQALALAGLASQAAHLPPALASHVIRAICRLEPGDRGAADKAYTAAATGVSARWDLIRGNGEDRKRGRQSRGI